MKIRNSLGILILTINWFFAKAQNFGNDSLRATEIFKKIETKKGNDGSRKIVALQLPKSEVLKISKRILYYVYGKRKISKQMPFHMIKINQQWIIWGTKNSKNCFGGVFEMIINDQNACVEFLTHGK